MAEVYKTEDNKKRMVILDRISKELKVGKNAVVIAWMLQSTTKVIPLISASTELQLTENLAAMDIYLSDSQMD